MEFLFCPLPWGVFRETGIGVIRGKRNAQYSSRRNGHFHSRTHTCRTPIVVSLYSTLPISHGNVKHESTRHCTQDPPGLIQCRSGHREPPLVRHTTLATRISPIKQPTENTEKQIWTKLKTRSQIVNNTQQSGTDVRVLVLNLAKNTSLKFLEKIPQAGLRPFEQNTTRIFKKLETIWI